MEINFYKVNGINEEDTILFQSLSNQETYFESHKVLSLDDEDTFYPPYYKNKIKVSVEDIDFDSDINYLSIELRNKVYYYFIQNYSYISEDVIQLEITMDTIQTFLFDFSISGLVERKHIKRWISENTINREYIRENFAKGYFHEMEHYICNQDNIICAVAVTTQPLDSETFSFLSGNVEYSKLYLDTQKEFGNLTKGNEMEGCFNSIYYIPLYEKNANENHVFSHTTKSSVAKFDNLIILDTLRRASQTKNIFIIPFSIFDNLASIYDSDFDRYLCEYDTNLQLKTKFGIDCYGNGAIGFIGHEATTSGGNYELGYPMPIKSNTYSFNFSRNTTIGVNKNKMYTPQLIDENYYSFDFGDISVRCNFPLHYLTSVNIYTFMYANVNDGTRYYFINNRMSGISGKFEEIHKNKYESFAINSQPITLDLLNDAWVDYQANNKNRWGQFALSSVENIANSTIKGFSKGSYGGGVGLVSSALNVSLQSIERNLMEDNIKNIPLTIRKNGNAESFNFSISDIYYRIKEVDDINVAFEYYYKYGYKVNELKYISNYTNFKTYINNRHYFNFIKFVSPKITFTNILQSSSIINDMQNRFINGIRFWNEGININTYDYDNVEN